MFTSALLLLLDAIVYQLRYYECTLHVWFVRFCTTDVLLLLCVTLFQQVLCVLHVSIGLVSWTDLLAFAQMLHMWLLRVKKQAS